MSRKTQAAFDTEELNVSVTGRNIQVSDAMKDYAVEKLTRMERFGLKMIEAHMIMDIQRTHHRVDIILKIGHTTVKSQAITDNMYGSIDKAVDKIQSQLMKYKKRLQEHQAKGRAVIEMRVNVLKGDKDPLDEINEEIDYENERRLEEAFKPHQIVATETRPLKVLNHQEALMKMDLSQDLFMIFRNEETNKLEVIYRRNDGNYGLIQPES